MITKSLRNAVAAAAATGALIAPGAMTVAPQIANSACRYPNQVVTDTSLNMQPTYNKGTKGFATVVVVSDAKIPNGKVRFRVPAADWAVTKRLNDEGQRRFRVPLWKLAPGDYTAHSKFFGRCRFKNSSDTANFSVARKS